MNVKSKGSVLLFHRINHVVHYVSCVDQSAEFYQSHFSFIKDSDLIYGDGRRIVILKLGDTFLELVARDDDEPHPLHLSIMTPNFDAAIEQLALKSILAFEPPRYLLRNQQGPRTASYLGLDNEIIEVRGS